MLRLLHAKEVTKTGDHNSSLEQVGHLSAIHKVHLWLGTLAASHPEHSKIVNQMTPLTALTVAQRRHEPRLKLM